MENPIDFPSHLGGEFFCMKPEDLPDNMLVASTKGSHIKADIYLQEIVGPRIEQAEEANDITRLQELREVARTLHAIIGEIRVR